MAQVKPKDRKSRILELVERTGEATVEGLVAQFGVSAETIRRDLGQLAELGALHKVHGGAKRLRLHVEGSFEERMGDGAAAKAVIARKLRAMVGSGDTVFIDTGTTTLACAQALAEVPGLTVITNGPRLAQVLARGEGGVRVFLVGGTYDGENGETVGSVALSQIAQFHADYAVVGAAAVDAVSGAMAADFEEAAVARAMCANARQIIVCAHNAKIGRRAAHRICRLEEMAAFICNDDPPDNFKSVLTGAGVQLR